MAHYVLVVEGEAEIARHLRSALALEGYDVIVVADGHSALSLIDGAMPDLMIIDAAAPVVNGTEVTRRIRAAGMDIPIIMLASRAADTQPVAAFDAGIDDFLPDPDATDELLVRIRVQLRHREHRYQGDVLRFGPLKLDQASREVFVGDRSVVLTATEFDTLILFMNHPHRVLKRAFIYEQVWGYDFGPLSNLIEVYVSSLRHKLAAAGAPELIHTVRGIGYILDDHRHCQETHASANP